MIDNALNKTSRIRVVMANTIPLIRRALREFMNLEQDLEVIAQTGEGDEAVMLVTKLSPDVAVVDVDIPTINGIETTKRIKEIRPLTKVLVLTNTDNHDVIRAIIQAGANGYLSLHENPEVIIHAIRKISSGDEMFYPINLIDPQAVSYNIKSLLQDTAIEITPRELSVLKLIANGLSNKDIASKLGLSLHYVKAHITRIYTKLGVSSRTQAISTGLKAGLLSVNDLNQ